MRRRYSRTRPSGALLATPARAAGAALVFVLLIAFLIRMFAPGAFTAIAIPFWTAGSVLSNATAGTVSPDSRASLREDRERLVRENESLANQNALLAARAADLERLLGGRAEAAGGIVAGVLVRPPVSPYDLLVVDRGSADGVASGAAVYGAGGIPVGTIAEAAETTSRVSLYSTTGRVTDGWIGANRAPVQLTGTGAGAYDAQVDAAAGVLVGDAVYVPGPGALPIGAVTEIVTDPSSPAVVLRIRGQVNPFSLTWVTIAR